MKTNDNSLAATDTLNDDYFWELDLYTGQLFWSDGICKLLDWSKPCTPTLEQLISYYQPENIRPAFNRAIHQGISFELEIPAQTAFDKVIMVCTTANPVYDNYGKCIAIKGVLSTEQQQETNAETLAFAADTLEEQTLMFKNFSRIVSHNLRSHTSNLQMVLESVNQNTSSTEMRDVIGNIKTISSNLNQTVGYLNTLVKI